MNISIIGASGYSGAELASLLAKHPHFNLVGCYVSAGSLDKGKQLSDLYPEHLGLLDMPLLPLEDAAFPEIAANSQAVCLCTDHKVSVDLAPQFLELGLKVFDLSGGFRLACNEDYEKYYGFSHPYPNLLEKAQYGLAEWFPKQIADADLIAVAGCYPTAALNALKPLKKAGLLHNSEIIINAVSGVTGAGRKANIATQFCEVSLSAYGLFNHRHGPEISRYLDHPVLFTPHLGNFKRGILETIYVDLKPNTSPVDIDNAFHCLGNEPLIRITADKLPSIKQVEGRPYVDIGWRQSGNKLIIVVAIDNLLKGAAGQALQCLNLQAGYSSELGLKEIR